jgi:hypothetical protein
MMVSVLVGKSENELDETIYNRESSAAVAERA